MKVKEKRYEECELLIDRERGSLNDFLKIFPVLSFVTKRTHLYK